MKSVRITLYVGQYAFKRYLGETHDTLTDAVRAFDSLLPSQIALPHPSPRNNIWLKKNRWYENETLPALRPRIRTALTHGA